MADHGAAVAVHMHRFEDFTAKIEWLTEWGEAMPIFGADNSVAWIRCDVVDGTGTPVIQMSNQNLPADPDNPGVWTGTPVDGFLYVYPQAGWVNMWIPWQATKEVPEGSYRFDMFIEYDADNTNNSFGVTKLRRMLLTGSWSVHGSITDTTI